jgi:hypothetical protein
MTVLMREDMNDADLAWAAADASIACAMEQLLRARETLADEHKPARRPQRDGGGVDPAVLRARGAL